VLSLVTAAPEITAVAALAFASHGALRGGSTALLRHRVTQSAMQNSPHLRSVPVSMVPTTMPTEVSTALVMPVPMLVTRVMNPVVRLGASLRDRACRGGSLRSPPVPVRRAWCVARPLCSPHRRGLLVTALCAALVAVLASLALARRGRTPCGAVLRTTPCTTRCTPARSNAAAAPPSRSRR